MKRFTAIATVALVMGTIVGCGGETTDTANAVQTEKIEKVETLTLSKETVARELELSSTLEGYESMSVAPSLTGKNEHIYVEVGSRVNKGQLLIRMDQNQLNTTRISLNSVQTEFNRVEALKESGSVSQQVYDQTKAQLDNLKQSESFLEENTFVKAQFSGVIAAKNYEDGELYAGTPILTLTQINTLKAIINIPESYFPLVKKGMKVDVTSDIYPNEIFPATIEIVYPTIDAASHTFQAKVRIPNNSEKIRPGMFAKAKLAIGEVETMVVPYNAVLKLQGSNNRYIFLDRDGVAKRVDVVLGQRFDDRVEVISDEIKEGDKIVVVGQARLIDGIKLDVVNK